MTPIKLEVDVYTKIILTVIAVALTGQLLLGLVGPREAGATAQVADVNIARIGGMSVFGPELPVKLAK